LAAFAQPFSLTAASFTNSLVVTGATLNASTATTLTIQFTWAGPSNYTFNCGRSTAGSGGPWTDISSQIFSSPFGGVVLTATGLNPLTNYWFRVASIDTAANQGPYTTWGAFATVAGVLPSLVPTSAIAITPGNNQLSITMSDSGQTGTQPVTYQISIANSATGTYVLVSNAVEAVANTIAVAG
jgi:hypothetical protein